MKESECNLSHFLLGAGMKIHDVTETKDSIIFYAKSTSFFSCCPKCGRASTVVASTYTRELQDLPVRLKTSLAVVSLHKYRCQNPDCSQRVFSEDLTFAGAWQRRTEELNAFLFALSIFMGEETLSVVLEKLGIRVSNSAIGRLWDKISISDHPGLEFCVVDDIALDKGQDYATAVYDGLTHDLVALLDGRDGKTFREWLLDHPEIKIVCRDRSSAFSRAVTDVLGNIIQIADRFHLIQNIIGYVKEAVKKILPKSIVFKEGEIVEGKIPKVNVPIVPLDSPTLEKYLDYDNSKPVDSAGNPVLFEDKERDLTSERYKKLEEARKEKQEKIRTVRKEMEECLESGMKTGQAAKEVAAKRRISDSTAKNYFNMTEEDISALDAPRAYKKRSSNMDDCANIIYKMMADGIEFPLIFSAVLKRFPEKDANRVIGFMRTFAKNNFGQEIPYWFPYKQVIPPGYVKLSRHDIVKYMTRIKHSEEPSEREKLYGKVLARYPELEIFQESYLDFHEIIMGSDPAKLDRFLSDSQDGFLGGLVNGIKKDIAAVKNAISYEENSGLAEGGNHKVKLIKKIGYGRNSVKKLFKKAAASFSIYSEGFDLLKIMSSHLI